jgi:DNA mismatch repair ATPase MutS
MKLGKKLRCGDRRIIVFLRLADQHRKFVQDLVMNLQALAIVLERRGYLASCYTCGGQMNSASFMVSLADSHLIRFLVSDYGITWTEMRDDRELMKLEGAEAISQLQELANLVKYQIQPSEVVPTAAQQV